jgi:hypothetical protein
MVINSKRLGNLSHYAFPIENCAGVVKPAANKTGTIEVDFLCDQ